MRKSILTLLLFLGLGVSYGHTQSLDSLLLSWNNQNEKDTVRFNAVHKYILKTFKKDTDFALQLTEKQLLFSQSKSSQYWESKAFNNFGFIWEKKRDFEKSLDYFQKALILTKASNHQRGIAAITKNIGDLYTEKLNNDWKAAEYFQQSILAADAAQDLSFQTKRHYDLGRMYRKVGEFHKALGEFLTGLNHSKYDQNIKNQIRGNRLIANFYQQLSDYENSIKYNEENLKLSLEIKSKSDIAMTYNNLGNCYFLTERYEEALGYYLQSLELKKELKRQPEIANTYHNLGKCYLVKQDLEQAKHFFELALAKRETQNNTRDLPNSYCALGEVQMAIKNYEKAIEWCEKGLKFAQKEKELDRSISNCECLARVYEKAGNFEKALEYKNLNLVLKDSFLNVEKIKKVGLIEAKQQFIEQHQSTKTINQRENKNQFSNQFLVGITLFLLMILAFFIYKNYAPKKEEINANQERNTLVKESNPARSISDTKDAEWLAATEKIISKFIDQQSKFKVSDIAEQLFLSERQFRRRLQQITGLTPNKYIIEIKLNKARLLFEKQTFESVKEVMHLSGFRNGSYFSKVYFERFGRLPSEYFG